MFWYITWGKFWTAYGATRDLRAGTMAELEYTSLDSKAVTDIGDSSACSVDTVQVVNSHTLQTQTKNVQFKNKSLNKIAFSNSRIDCYRDII